ncbi:MAG: hypothetical protein JO067_11245 [Cupriavidus sp.]|nr:hypothetical protein [Cupriavidus sp.]
MTSSEKFDLMVRAQAYNEAIFDAKRVVDRKLADVSEQFDFLLQDE